MSRDICRHIIDLDLYDVKLVSMGWGGTPMNALDAVVDVELIKRIVMPPVQLPRAPELFIQISVPNEFAPVGKYNIGITAGIETTAISKPWIDGCNRMNVIWTISEHSKSVIEHTVMEERDQHNNLTASHKVTVPIDVLHNCIHTDIIKKISAAEVPATVRDVMLSIKEKFCFLFVGHWLKGNLGEDRKNVGLLTNLFCQAFKNIPASNKPALILKTSGAGFSILDREECLAKIKAIKDQLGPNCPNIYLLHGEFTDEEMNGLYNHPKVKVHVSLTKGEGFGRPLLEATQSEKPVIASGWSGQLDFLEKDLCILLPGELKKVDASAVWPDVIIEQSAWFNVDANAAGNAMLFAYKRYDTLLVHAKQLAISARNKFSYDVIKTRTKTLLDQYVPKMAIQSNIKLPSLKKITRPVELNEETRSV
jgi:glycosyltransferase involved in cell wall biosynthesis